MSIEKVLSAVTWRAADIAGILEDRHFAASRLDTLFHQPEWLQSLGRYCPVPFYPNTYVLAHDMFHHASTRLDDLQCHTICKFYVDVSEHHQEESRGKL